MYQSAGYSASMPDTPRTDPSSASGIPPLKQSAGALRDKNFKVCKCQGLSSIVRVMVTYRVLYMGAI
ncbi:hypothetical protein OIDMADRAFT_18472 [Oidiodendron maius Zn]|uniref:Uncharacterized protein n=1 Tax=Oidiodendron maius (strain Zn) TaxID=913774 RepID=A0A0C3HIF1_OIDMZ|nr:hypothetical protein OIDMADRAFT_18472 [Oidiodendron maius Zn]